jgi:centromere protein K
MNLDLRLNRKVNLEMQKVNVIEQPEETLIELQFREKLSEQIQQFKKTIEILRGEIKQVTHAVSRETVVLKECQDIGKSLIQREQLLRQEKSVNRDTAAELRLKLASIQREYDLDIKDMTEFLDDNYPVHVVDGQGPLGDECELKIILEQLLNRAYQHPENPYLPLVPGTYWSPYVQTLVGAGIARYHPNDINRLRLENFKE